MTSIINLLQTCIQHVCKTHTKSGITTLNNFGNVAAEEQTKKKKLQLVASLQACVKTAVDAASDSVNKACCSVGCCPPKHTQISALNHVWLSSVWSASCSDFSLLRDESSRITRVEPQWTALLLVALLIGQGRLDVASATQTQRNIKRAALLYV